MVCRYDARATNIVSDFQLHRRKFCRLPQVLLRVTHFTADALFLFPPTTRSLQADLETLNSASSPIQYISKTAAWPILSEEKCFQVGIPLTRFRNNSFYVGVI
jgi:hypothetical protein